MTYKIETMTSVDDVYEDTETITETDWVLALRRCGEVYEQLAGHSIPWETARNFFMGRTTEVKCGNRRHFLSLKVWDDTKKEYVY